MEWRAEGILLSVRKHGESAAIIDTLTAEHGRHAGLVHGGTGKRHIATLQPGNQLALAWRGRLAENLGVFGTAELIRSRAAIVIGNREALATLDSARALLSALLPERAAMPVIYEGTLALFDALGDTDARRLAYARWEMMLLTELGLALDLRRCAVTGERTGLAYVSPRSGRAVTAVAAGEYADRLLPLPPFLIQTGIAPDRADLAAALTMTGFFLETWAIQNGLDAKAPPARDRLVALLSKHEAER
jgi:DNA repair protein RecO (recombination protein O)